MTVLHAMQSPDAQPYWAGLKGDGEHRGQLLVQRCRACGKHRHYPRPLCPACHAFEVDWVPVSSTGTVYSWTVVHQSALPAYANQVPYTLLTVDMPEGVRLLGRWVDAGDGHDLATGLAVRVAVETGPDGTPQPVFRRV